MTPAVRLRLQAVKEVRELLLAWVACLAAIAMPSLVGRWYGMQVLAYVLGTAGLGALAVGHEYSYRTMPTLLAQPIDRRRLLATKLAVVAVMLAPIGCLFALTFHAETIRELGFNHREQIAAFFVPMLGALFVAPWLTLATRSPIAGAVFAPSFLGAPMPLTQLLKLLTGTSVHPPRVALWTAVALCAVAAFFVYRSFMRLEAIDGQRSSIALPRWRLGRASPVWLLVSKELHLQRMTFLVGALYVPGWIAAIALSPVVTHAVGIYYVLSFFHCFEIALLAGSLASAEERQAGTLAWQLLTPFPIWKQWLIKISVVLVITIALGCGLPALAAAIVPATHGAAPHAGFFVSFWMLSCVVVAAALSLYISSCSRNGLRALLVAIATVTIVATAGVYFNVIPLLAGRPIVTAVVAAIGTFAMLTQAMTKHRLLN